MVRQKNNINTGCVDDALRLNNTMIKSDSEKSILFGEAVDIITSNKDSMSSVADHAIAIKVNNSNSFSGRSKKSIVVGASDSKKKRIGKKKIFSEKIRNSF